MCHLSVRVCVIEPCYCCKNLFKICSVHLLSALILLVKSFFAWGLKLNFYKIKSLVLVDNRIIDINGQST